MPHDKNGRLLSVGDRVDIPCIIKSIQVGDDYCNVELESTEVMYPENKYKNTFHLNTRMVEKVEE